MTNSTSLAIRMRISVLNDNTTRPSNHDTYPFLEQRILCVRVAKKRQRNGI